MTDTDSLHRLAEYHTLSHDRTNDLHLSIDHMRRACRTHGLSVEELTQFLNTILGAVVPNQGIDEPMAALLDVCIQIEAQQGSEA